MNRYQKTFATALACSGLALAGCAPMVPRELVDARAAYQHASGSRASDLKPADLHQAKEALNKAEASFASEENTGQTLDLSYVAQRKAQLAEVLAGDRIRQPAEDAGRTVDHQLRARDRKTHAG